MEKVIEKINKMLAKTQNNSSEAECETAFLMAQELMMKHGLTMRDIEVEEKEEKVITEELEKIKRNSVWWHGRLAVIVARNFRCKTYLTRKKTTAFMGKESDINIAMNVHLTAIATIEYLANEYFMVTKQEYQDKGMKINKTWFAPYKNGYINGFLCGLSKKFDEQKDKNGWGLVVLPDKQTIDEFNKLQLKPSNKTKALADRGESFNKGYSDGVNHDCKVNLICNN